jgi:hypothetical protein
VRYAHDEVDPFWTGAVAAELRVDLALLSALVEQVGGAAVGRAIVGFDRPLSVVDVTRTFRRYGLAATPLDGAELPSSVKAVEPVLVRAPA